MVYSVNTKCSISQFVKMKMISLKEGAMKLTKDKGL